MSTKTLGISMLNMPPNTNQLCYKTKTVLQNNNAYLVHRNQNHLRLFPALVKIQLICFRPISQNGQVVNILAKHILNESGSYILYIVTWMISIMTVPYHWALSQVVHLRTNIDSTYHFQILSLAVVKDSILPV